MFQLFMLNLANRMELVVSRGDGRSHLNESYKATDLEVARLRFRRD